jgi:predicted secreted hydrolase
MGLRFWKQGLMTASWLVCLSCAVAGAAGDWRAASPGYAWDFPRDHHAHHDFATEWWYCAGQVAADASPTHRFGFHVTFFRIGLLPQPPLLDSVWATRGLVMSHCSLTDLATGEHLFSEALYRQIPLLGGFPAFPDTMLVWSLAPAGTDSVWDLSCAGTGFQVHVRDAAQEMGLSLRLEPRRPLVFQGPGGYSRKGASTGGASLYYSYPLLAVTGSLRWHGEDRRVAGTGWLDREFGSAQLDSSQVGWDWFSLQLDDGRQVMLYQLRRADGTVDHARGTLIDESGQPTYLTGEDWELTVTSRWHSERTDTTYPAAWRLRLPAAALTAQILPLAADQENVSQLARLHYWEGAVEVRGEGTGGRGYVELTGYGPDNRPPI